MARITVMSLSESIPEIWNILNDKEKYSITTNTRIVEFKKNEVIYGENDTPKDLMCLCQGKVKIFKEGVGGRSQIIRMIRPSQYFG